MKPQAAVSDTLWCKARIVQYPKGRPSLHKERGHYLLWSTLQMILLSVQPHLFTTGKTSLHYGWMQKKKTVLEQIPMPMYVYDDVLQIFIKMIIFTINKWSVHFKDNWCVVHQKGFDWD